MARKTNKYEVHEIKGTPFVTFEANGEHTLCLGNQAVCEQKFTSVKAATEYVNEKPWQLLTTTILVLIDKTKEK